MKPTTTTTVTAEEAEDLPVGSVIVGQFRAASLVEAQLKTEDGWAFPDGSIEDDPGDGPFELIWRPT